MAKAIYRIRNTVNDKFYVGSTKDTRKRFYAHKRRLRRGTHHCHLLQDAWNRHGEDRFEFEIVRSLGDLEDPLAIEQEWLDEHHGNEYCYNVSMRVSGPGGCKGEHHYNYGKKVSDEVRAKISASVQGLYEDPNYQPRTGKQHSKESRAKISEKVQSALADGRGGRFVPSAETRAKMSASLQGNQNAKGYKRTEAERKAISERMKGSQNWLGKKHSDESRAKMGKAVVEATSGQRFSTLSDAAQHYNMSSLNTILRSIKSGSPVSKGPNAGLVFAYEGDSVDMSDQEYPPTRKQAKEQGSKYYFTGKPCKHGHVAPRHVKGTCVECRKIEWQKSNKDRAGKPKSEASKAAGRRYYEKIKSQK